MAKAIAVNSLTSGSSTSDASSYNTASFTPTSNALVLVAIYTADRFGVGTAPTVSSMSGNGGTWAAIDNSLYAGTRERTTIYRTMIASPSAGAATITLSGTAGACSWSVCEFTGVDTSGTNGSGAIAANTNKNTSGASPLTLALSAFSDAVNNACYMALTVEDSSVTYTVGAGMTQIHNVANADGSWPSRLLSEYQIGQNTSPSASWSSGAFGSGGVAFEIKAAGGGGVTIVEAMLQAAGRGMGMGMFRGMR